MHTDAMLSLEEMESALNNKLYDGTRLLVSMVANALAGMQEEDWLAIGYIIFVGLGSRYIGIIVLSCVLMWITIIIILKGEIQTTIN